MIYDLADTSGNPVIVEQHPERDGAPVFIRTRFDCIALSPDGASKLLVELRALLSRRAQP